MGIGKLSSNLKNYYKVYLFSDANYFTLENDLYPTNCYKYENNNFSEDLKSSNNIICLDYITPEGYCVLTCPNGTYHFSLNNSCLYSCPHNYEIENNKCIFKSFVQDTI